MPDTIRTAQELADSLGCITTPPDIAAAVTALQGYTLPESMREAIFESSRIGTSIAASAAAQLTSTESISAALAASLPAVTIAPDAQQALSDQLLRYSGAISTLEALSAKAFDPEMSATRAALENLAQNLGTIRVASIISDEVLETLVRYSTGVTFRTTPTVDSDEAIAPFEGLPDPRLLVRAIGRARAIGLTGKLFDAAMVLLFTALGGFGTAYTPQEKRWIIDTAAQLVNYCCDLAEQWTLRDGDED